MASNDADAVCEDPTVVVQLIVGEGLWPELVQWLASRQLRPQRLPADVECSRCGIPTYVPWPSDALYLEYERWRDRFRSHPQ